MRSILKRLLGIKEVPPDPAAEFENRSYSQEGEDLLLNRIFPTLANGFYIDIGAHHPYRFSNTYFFYKRGWTGINIDPIPGMKKLFDDQRPKDTNLEIAISDTKATINYYNFKEKALNTFSEPLAKQYMDGNWELENIIPIETSPVAEIFDRFVPAGQAISFMSIDVEDLEMKVLQSNNWDKYRPQVLVVEMLDSSAEEMSNTEVASYLKQKGYTFYAKTVNSSFFKLIN